MHGQKEVIHIADYRFGGDSCIVDGLIVGFFRFRVIPVSWNVLQTLEQKLSGYRDNHHKEESPVCILVSPPSMREDDYNREGACVARAIGKFFPKVPVIWQTKEKFDTPAFHTSLPNSKVETIAIDYGEVEVLQRLLYLLASITGVEPTLTVRL